MNDQELIASIAAKQLGAPPAQAIQSPAPQAAQAPAAPAAPAAPPSPPKADQSPTNMEKAQAKVAPNDPSKQSAESVISFLNVGGRDYTEDQLKGTLGRYKELNYKWQTNKPTLDVIAQIMDSAKQAGYDAKPEEMAGLVEAAVKAYVKNPQMGGQKKSAEQKGGAQQPMNSGDSEEDAEGFGNPDALYEQWEKENAVKLPPGFKETAATSKAMSAKVDQMMAMFQKMMESGFGGQLQSNQAQQLNGEAQQLVQKSQAMQSDAALKMVSNNLNSAFAQAGVQPTPETRGDFRLFAAQRGYDFSDFMDPDLATTLVNDYKANKDAPEVMRLREMAKKRQAFTGMAAGSPGAGAPVAATGDPMLAAMVSSAMGKRNM